MFVRLHHLYACETIISLIVLMTMMTMMMMLMNGFHCWIGAKGAKAGRYLHPEHAGPDDVIKDATCSDDWIS